MMKPLTSLINIRFAVGATLAISAALAVVLSLTLSSDETASGAKHPNHEAVSTAVATLEAAVANSDADVEALQTAVPSVAAVTYDHDGDDPENDGNKADGSTAATDEISVVGMVDQPRRAT